jgi:hypothetical protein
MVSWIFFVSGPVVRQNIMADGHGGTQLLTFSFFSSQNVFFVSISHLQNLCWV